MSHNSLLESTVNLYATAKKVEEIDRSAYVCGFFDVAVSLPEFRPSYFHLEFLDSQNG
jgi:hypothetical protein